MDPEELDALMRLVDWQEKRHRRATRRRRLKKAGLLAAVLIPGAGPLVGQSWEENEHRGWK